MRLSWRPRSAILFGFTMALMGLVIPYPAARADSYQLQKSTLERLASVKADLQALPLIRVFINSAPGFGHQAASVHVIKRLRELGYTGEIEAIFESAVKDKLKLLLPGFDATKEDQTLTHLGPLRVVSDVFFAKHLVSRQARLGITGADDQKFRAPRYLGVDHYLKLQPAGWPGFNEIIDGRTGARTPLDELADLGIVTAAPVAAKLDEYLADLKSVGMFEQKASGLELLFRNSEDVDMATVYGMSDGGHDKYVAFLKALQVIQSERSNRPIIVPVLSRMPDQQMDYIRAQAGFENVSFASILDPDIQQRLQVGAGKILVLRVGGLTQDLFELLLLKANLPSTVAGKNAVHLMKQSGRAYLSTVAELPQAGPFGVDGQVKEKIQKAYAGLANPVASAESATDIANFIREAMNKDSRLSQFYKNFAIGSSTDSDKLSLALDRMRVLKSGASVKISAGSATPCNALLAR